MDEAALGAATHLPWRDRLTTGLQHTISSYQALGGFPNVRRLLAAAATSSLGSELNFIALIALAYHLGGSALAVGGLFTAAALPHLLAQGPAGTLVDRFPGPRLLILTQVLLAVIAAAFLLLLVIPSPWLLYTLVVLGGLVRTVDVPAFRVRLATLVPPAQRGTANALHVLTFSISRLAGPLLGGIALGLWGAAPLFVLNSLSFLAVAVTLTTIRPPATTVESTDIPLVTPPVVSPPSTIGYASLLRRRDVAMYTALTVSGGLFGIATLALFVVRAHALGLGEGGTGLFFAFISLGALAGGLIAGGVQLTGPRGFTIAAAASLAGTVFLIGFGLTGNALIACGALLLAGAVASLQEVVSVTVFQHTLPEAVYGRAFSLFLLAGSAGTLAGGLLGPALADRLGVERSLLLLAGPDAVLAVVCLLWAGSQRESIQHGLLAPTL